MLSRCSVMCLIIMVSFFGRCGGESDKKLDVIISFESLDSSCKSFFAKKLPLIYEDFSSIIRWNFIPCSASHFVDNKLFCVSPKACKINLLHACAAHKYETEQYRLGRFFLCMIPSRDQHSRGEECARKNGMDWNELENCAKSKEAEEYCDAGWNQLNELGEEGIPGVIFNRKYNKTLEKEAKDDLKATICSQLAALSIPSHKCTQSGDEENAINLILDSLDSQFGQN